MERENALDAFAITNAADGEHLVQAMPAAANDDPGKNLNAFLVAFDDFGMHAHGIADGEIRRVFAKLFGFDFIE